MIKIFNAQNRSSLKIKGLRLNACTGIDAPTQFLPVNYSKLIITPAETLNGKWYFKAPLGGKLYSSDNGVNWVIEQNDIYNSGGNAVTLELVYFNSGDANGYFIARSGNSYFKGRASDSEWEMGSFLDDVGDGRSLRRITSNGSIVHGSHSINTGALAGTYKTTIADSWLPIHFYDAGETLPFSADYLTAGESAILYGTVTTGQLSYPRVDWRLFPGGTTWQSLTFLDPDVTSKSIVSAAFIENYWAFAITKPEVTSEEQIGFELWTVPNRIAAAKKAVDLLDVVLVPNQVYSANCVAIDKGATDIDSGFTAINVGYYPAENNLLGIVRGSYNTMELYDYTLVPAEKVPGYPSLAWTSSSFVEMTIYNGLLVMLTQTGLLYYLRIS